MGAYSINPSQNLFFKVIASVAKQSRTCLSANLLLCGILPKTEGLLRYARNDFNEFGFAFVTGIFAFKFLRGRNKGGIKHFAHEPPLAPPNLPKTSSRAPNRAWSSSQ